MVSLLLVSQPSEQVVRACRLVVGAGRKAGILPPEKDAVPRVDFVGFGLVLGADGKRIRTRDEGAVRGSVWKPEGSHGTLLCVSCRAWTARASAPV